MFIKIALGVGLLIGVIGLIIRKEIMRHVGYILAWFALLCGSYKNPMFGQGIDPGAGISEILAGLNPGLIISLLFPLVMITIHLFFLYKAMYARKDNNEKQ